MRSRLSWVGTALEAVGLLTVAAAVACWSWRVGLGVLGVVLVVIGLALGGDR